MKKSIVVLMVVFAILAVAQQPPQQPPAPGQQPAAAQSGQQPPAPGQPAAAAPQQQKKEIKDPAEYNAYMGALNTADPNQKAIAMEGFLQQFPNSVMKPDALELLMAAYEQSGNAPKVTDAAQRLLQVDPNNLKALALLTYTARAQAETNPSTAQQNLAQAGQYANQGLQALQTAQKPEGMSDADWQKLKTQVAVIFNGAAGQNDFAQKNYPAAVQHLGAAVEGDPNNLRNVYPLALAYMETNPPNPLGLWYIARAVALTAQAPAQQQQIARFGRSRYIKYHGGDDGWNELVQQAAASPQPPAGFTVKPAPTPAEQAATLVQQKKVSDMSFDEIQMVLTSGNQQAADQVWNELKGKPTKFVAKVVEATPTKLTLSATAEDIEKNAADVDLTMTAAIPARLVPKPGAMVPVQGTPVSYTPNPFVITMSSGILGASEKPAAAAPATKKTPPKRTTKKP